MSTEIAKLPETGDQSQWNESEKALVEAAGLVTKTQGGRVELAPRATVEAFLQHCRRTGLDPIARQIYAICRKGRWGIQVSIDGARLVAERSGEYEGQTPVEWTKDGVTWTQVWLQKGAPAAARVGVYRTGFREPMYAVANFDAYNAGGPMWSKMPALMIGKCAEMLALRKAFPMELSGLYSTEEMDQAGQPKQAARVDAKQKPEPVQAAVSPVAASSDADYARDWFAEARACKTLPELRDLYKACRDAGDLGKPVEDGAEVTFGDLMQQLSGTLPEQETVEAEVVEDTPMVMDSVNEQTGEVEWETAVIPTGGEQ